MWSDALKQMEQSKYQWDNHFSQHELRALMIQQSHEIGAKQKLTLQDYVKTHGTPDAASKRSANENYPHDNKTKETYVRMQKGMAPGRTRHEHAAHSEHHHAAHGAHPHEPAHVPKHAFALESKPRASRAPEPAPKHPLLNQEQFVPNQMEGALAHNELDDVPDDFRV